MSNAETRKPGQFTGKWEVYSLQGVQVVLARNMSKSEAENLLANHKRNGTWSAMRSQRVMPPPDIAALDSGDDE